MASDPDPDDAVADEQDLLVVFRLSTRDSGSPREVLAIEALGDELDQLVSAAGVGEFAGDETGGGECTLFFCGPEPQALINVLRPVLRQHSLCRGGQFVRMIASGDGFERRQEPI